MGEVNLTLQAPGTYVTTCCQPGRQDGRLCGLPFDAKVNPGRPAPEDSLSKEKLSRLLEALDGVTARAAHAETTYSGLVGQLDPEQLSSGLNLLHYLALRAEDVRGLQQELATAGLSSLANAEAHVLASVFAVQGALRRLLGQAPQTVRPPLTFKQGRGRIHRHATMLWGKKLKGSPIRIMVTLPEDAADDYGLVRDMMRAGMNCARINCAQGGPAEWERMVTHVHRARSATGRGCRIYMDLSGPKIRIGTIASEPAVLKIGPERDARGKVIRPSVVEIVTDHSTPEQEPRDHPGIRIPLPARLRRRLRPRDRLHLVDTRGKKAFLEIDSVDGGSVRASCPTTVYLETGLPLVHVRSGGEKAGEGVVGRLPAPPGEIVLRPGDTLVVHREPTPGEPERPGTGAAAPIPAHVSCVLPAVFDYAEVGQPLLLDDGRIGTVIREAGPDRIVVEVTQAELEGTTLRAHKGINLPETQLGISGLTEKDREDLRFIAAHADGVNASFINLPSDVEALLEELRAVPGRALGIVLKIETRSGVENLPGILLAAMQWPLIGVMIARGDLAVEVGWADLARTQEEILRVSEAAHVPVIWATEVLDRLAKKGVPTRAEISDVVMAGRAECVMLNKGPYITNAIRTLETILASLEGHQSKKAMLLPELTLTMPDLD